ncbi:MAG: [Fe-Fe] hydrogenase large subunit C-terminal domain-containing protein [Thermoleophilia bacterium]
MEFLSFEITSNDFKKAGSASRSLKEQLKLVGADPESIRRAMIAAYEAEMNVVIHSLGGRMEVHIADVGIHVDIIDKGPGIPDVSAAMKEGYSTANAEARALGFGAGMGLPNIKRSADRMRVTSQLNVGTRVSFSVFFKQETPGITHAVSLQLSPPLCQECRRCLTTCPTEAIRMRNHLPMILEHVCIDCGACVAACKPGALTVRNDVRSLLEITERARAQLVVPPALLADCGARYSPERVLEVLHALGFADVISLVPYETALRKGVAAASKAEGALLPVINPICPAIVNLIELRFPSLLPHLAQLESPFEAVQALHADQPMVYVVSCPSQRSVLLEHELARGMLPGRETITEYVTSDIARQAAMEILVRQPDTEDHAAPASQQAPTGATSPAKGVPVGPRTSNDEAAEADPGARAAEEATHAPFVVTGVEHVVAVLEQLEDGLLDEIAVIEPYACLGGCFGSPLLKDDYHVIHHRWEEAGNNLALHAPGAEGGSARAMPRRLPFTPRPGIRLDIDMAIAVEKLGKLQDILRSLPHRQCAVCGAPTCSALAEDVILGRAAITDCPYVEVKEEDPNE